MNDVSLNIFVNLLQYSETRACYDEYVLHADSKCVHEWIEWMIEMMNERMYETNVQMNKQMKARIRSLRPGLGRWGRD